PPPLLVVSGRREWPALLASDQRQRVPEGPGEPGPCPGRPPAAVVGAPSDYAPPPATGRGRPALPSANRPAPAVARPAHWHWPDRARPRRPSGGAPAPRAASRQVGGSGRSRPAQAADPPAARPLADAGAVGRATGGARSRPGPQPAVRRDPARCG